MSDRFPRVSRQLWYFLALFALVIAAYSPALRGGFLWDDDGHVTKADLQSLDGLRRIWFEVGASQQYYPVLHTAFWIQHRLWGDEPFGYHLVNILLHATAACLLAAVLKRLLATAHRPLPTANRIAWLAAALFAIHPVNVESVAWISEQKNTLSAVFYLSAALLYLRHVGASSLDGLGTPSLSNGLAGARIASDVGTGAASDAPTWRTYAGATALFVCALLSKSVTATLPAALLVVIWWQRGRVERRDVVPLLPWFAAGIGAGLFTAYVERTYIGAEVWQYDLSFIGRILLAGHVPWFYLGKLVWPAGLAFNYPRWSVSSTDGSQWLYLVGSAAVLLAAYAWRKRSRGPLAALLFFGGTLFPALGFFGVYPFQYSYVADHFQYLAAIGIFVLAAGALSLHLPRRSPAPAGRSIVLICVPLIAALVTITAKRSYLYADSDRLWRATIDRNPGSWLAHDAIGQRLLDDGEVEAALAEFQTAARLNPSPVAENSVAIALQIANRLPEAIAVLEHAVAAWPNYVDAHNNLGTAYARMGRMPEAIGQMQFAVRLKPRESRFRYNLGLALRDTGDLNGAAAQFQECLAIDPNSVEALIALGISYLNLNRFAEAIPHLERALQLQPNQPDLERALAAARQRAGK